MFEQLADTNTILTLETALISGLSACGAAILYLWNFITKQIGELREQAEECEADRKNLYAMLLERKSNCGDCKQHS